MSNLNMVDPDEGFIKSRYNELGTGRDTYLQRAYDFAKVTIPSLMPDRESGTETSAFQNDFQTEGAKLLNSLANRYVETLFPAGRSFIKLSLPDDIMEQQKQQGRGKADIESMFAQIEREHTKKMVALGGRPALLEALKHAIAIGPFVLYLPQGGKLQTYALDEFVVSLSLDGTMLELITRDQKKFMMLPPEIQALVATELQIDMSKDDDLKRDVDLYTYIRRNPENTEEFLVNQAVESFNLEEVNSYQEDNLRWIYSGWNRTRRESYYRGLVEEHYGSFWTLSILSEAEALGCITMADIKYLVRPGSVVDVAALNASASGTYHYGEAEDINEVTSNRTREFQLISNVIERYKQHLGEIFMYTPAALRSGERVTAEEVRRRIAALENAHGGVYSILAETLQKPLAKLIFSEMKITGLEGAVDMQITTGLDALSRGNENDKINYWVADLTNTQNLPDEVRGRIVWEDYMKVTAAGRDVDFTKIVMDEATYQGQLQQAAQQQAGLDAQVKQAGMGGPAQQPKNY